MWTWFLRVQESLSIGVVQRGGAAVVDVETLAYRAGSWLERLI
jgi:hypothetical protein